MVLQNFDDSSEWDELLNGTATIMLKSTDTLQIQCNVDGDFAALASKNSIITEGSDISVYVDRLVAKTMLIIRGEKIITDPLIPTEGNYLYAFIRDVGYGVQIYTGYGYPFIQADSKPAETPVELRITVQDGVISFYYDGALVYSENIKPRMESIYIYLVAYATSKTKLVPGTTTFSSSYLEPPVEPLILTVSPLSATLKIGESQAFNATVSGGVAPYTIEWIDSLTNSVLGTGETFNYQAITVGEFEIYARTTDAQGSQLDSNIVMITVEESSVEPPDGAYPFLLPLFVIFVIVLLAFSTIGRKRK